MGREIVAAAVMLGFAACGDDPLPLPAYDAGVVDTGPACVRTGYTIWTDPQNCGECSVVCDSGRACFGGRCDTRPIIDNYAPCPTADSYCRNGRCVGIGVGGPKVCSPYCDVEGGCPASTLGGSARPICQTQFNDQCLLVCYDDTACPAGLVCRFPTATSAAGVCAQ